MNPSAFNLPLIRYQFDFHISSALKIPPNPGKLWHGALGNALRSNVCRVENLDCEDCMFAKRCDYTYLFKRVKHRVTGILQHQKNIPSPHFIQFDQMTAKTYQANDQLSIDIVLAGDANQRLPIMIEAMTRLGELGIYRQPITLIKVSQLIPALPPVYVWEKGSYSPPLNISFDLPKIPNIPLKIQFISQYIRPTKEPFDPIHWLKSVTRRLIALQTIYGDGEPDIEFLTLKNLIEQCSISHLKMTTYSNANTKKMETSGILGSFILASPQLHDLWPWLYWGQWINSGGRSGAGFGRYKISLINK